MGENYLTDIKERMAEYELPGEPEGLWKGISEASDTSSRKAGAGWGVAALAVAASLVVIFLIPRLNKSSGLVQGPSEPLAELREDAAPRQDSSLELLAEPRENVLSNEDAAPPTPSELQTASGLLAQYRQSEQPQNPGTHQIDASPEIPAQPTQTAPQAPEKQAGQTQKPPQTSETPFRNSGLYAQSTPGRESRRSRVSLGFYASGTTGSNNNQMLVSSHPVTAVGSDNIVWEDSPVLGLLAFNQGRSMTRVTRHHQPIRAGISLTIPLRERFSLETGLGCSVLVSDCREGSEEHYASSTQTLTYLSLPLNARYRIYPAAGGKSSFELYASGGVLAQKCISAKGHRQVVLGGSNASTADDQFSTLPFQFSVGAALGAQYSLLKNVGLYFEPGIAYYFDDGSTLQTIYKQKPLNFTFNIGLRFSL